jgi:peptidoglycan/LPS O-acetylase OafA/YrhL
MREVYSSMDWLKRQFEVSRAGSGGHVRPMEGLRGLAILLVFFVHYVTLIEPWVVPDSALKSFADKLHTVGNTGVDLFFVLSGYLIYGSLISKPQQFKRYMARRIERIYPTFALVFAIYVALSFLLPAQSKLPSGFGPALVYLVQNFMLLPGLFPIPPMITVAWSLSYEMFYYLVIPTVIAGLRLRDRSSAFRVGMFCAVAVLAAAAGAAFGGPVRLVMFIAGILLFEALSHRLAALPDGWALLALGLGFGITLLPLAGPAGYTIKVGALFLAFFAVCQSCFLRPQGWLPRAFSWTPLRWLGNMSYSYYLVHGLALRACVILLGVVLPPSAQGEWFFLALMVATFLATVLVAAALFLLIERPFSLSTKKSGARAGLRPAEPSAGAH